MKNQATILTSHTPRTNNNKHHTMKKHRQLPLFLVLVFIFIPQVLSQNFSQTPSVQVQANRQTQVDNETIYRVSKQLCWGCIAESIEFLFAHNLVRAAKFELPLAWNFQLEKYARWWAAQRKGDCRLQHSFPEDDFKLGENIFWGSGSAWRPLDAVTSWAREVKYYKYDTNSCEAGQMCGHYTQIVWRNTQRMGCARVVCDNGDIFMTCNYDPPGNYVGERPY